MDSSLELLNSTVSEPAPDEPRLDLLYPWESRSRAFFRNLVDLLLGRPVPAVRTTSPPGSFWPDVFVDSSVPWWSVLESIGWHLLVVMAIWGISLGGTPRKQFEARKAYHDSPLIYYPSESYPAQSSAPPKVRPQSRPQTARQKAMSVTPEHTGNPGLVTPPDLKAALAPPALDPGNTALPAVPLSAAERSRMTTLGGFSSVIAPPPQLNQDSTLRANLGPDSVVAPPPEVRGLGGRRSAAMPGGSVVAPSPALQGSSRRVGNLVPGTSGVVAPPPNLLSEPGSGAVTPRGGWRTNAVVAPAPEQGAASLGASHPGALAARGAQIVPPPPALRGADRSDGSGGGRGMRSLAHAAAVVPPPPSVRGAGDSFGPGRGGRLSGVAGSGVSPAVVPPPPSLQAGGNGLEGERVDGLGGNGTRVVPPPPAVQGGSNGSAGGPRIAGLGGGGTGVVPPPPSAQGAGTLAGSGRLGSLPGSPAAIVPPPPAVHRVSASNGTGGIGTLSGNGATVVPPPPAMSGTGGSNPGGHLRTMPGAGTGAVAAPEPVQMASTAGQPLLPVDDPPETASPTAPPASVAPPPPTEELPMRLIGMAVASTNTSYFSNYEIYLAERRIGKNQTQLIKLVYTFLPYQRRLSEYVLEGGKVFKLRVVRDPDCDESLLQMTWPEADQPPPNVAYASDPALTKFSRNTILECYRTTADDYRRAVMR